MRIKRSAALIAALTLSTPSLSEVITRGTANYGAEYEVKSRRGGVVILQYKSWIGRQVNTKSIWTIDCPNRQMVVDYETSGLKKTTKQNVWRSDGNLWFATKRGKRFYRISVAEYYDYGCNGILPEDYKVVK